MLNWANQSNAGHLREETSLDERLTLGIDIGAMTIKTALLATSGRFIKTDYRFHRGDPLAAARDALSAIAPDRLSALGITGSGAGLCPAHPEVTKIDPQRAMIRAVRRSFPAARNLLDIGGASVTLVKLDAEGNFRSLASNSQCAAGTGSFLDEQAERLGLTHAEMAQLPRVANPPTVATRCAVFAKSDLIHLQQEGSSKEEMWSGLCRGMAHTALQTLLKGRKLSGTTVLVGGVSRNQEVLRWLRQSADAPIVCDELSHLCGAIGAALIADQSPRPMNPIDWREWLAPDTRGLDRRQGAAGRNGTNFDRQIVAVAASPACGDSGEAPGGASFAADRSDLPLELRRTRYPSFAVEESRVDAEANEIRISRWPRGREIRGVLGVDIGSTSTKLCLIDDTGEVIVDIYRRTGGNPIGATRSLFAALEETAARRKTPIKIEGCGTTGSGRKLVGAVIGADAIVNEISSHAKAALRLDPEIETIFEIGGQDSKYTRCRDGVVVQANMNYVCAAGTGSFVEEQARKLGIPLTEIGALVLGTVPPPTSDRCTVFMEQDVHRLLQEGRSSREALAAVMRSVVQNYLNQVVGNRPWSREKIFFQGATARNQGLVAAFETLLDVEVVVSSYCHVMGAWGVALLTQQRLRRASQPSTFVGLDLSARSVALRKDRCAICDNDCEITHASIEGVDDEPSWGYLCGRDPDDERMRVLSEYDLFRKRRKALHRSGAVRAAGGERRRIAIPWALTMLSELPRWRRFLEELGAEVVLSGASDRAVRARGAALTAAEFCFPIKVAHGHLAGAVEAVDADFVFLPHLVAQATAPTHSNSYLCPYVQSSPWVMGSALAVSGIDQSRLLRPILDRRLSQKRQVQALHKELGPALSVGQGEIDRALRAGDEAQSRFESLLLRAGAKSLVELSAQRARDPLSRPGIVIVGRPYNVADPGLNLDLPRKIAELGYRVFPIDALPFEPEGIDPAYRNVFWANGQRILSALAQVRANDDLFAICFTNFNCGPDSILLSYAEETMGKKPMLAIELDEHGADAGYMTRIEAFLDVVEGWRPRKHALPSRNGSIDSLEGRRIYIPNLHPLAGQLFAAAFRGDGHDAVAMPVETQADLEIGQRLARGAECLPLRTTIGSFINLVRATGGEPSALFMPTASGPCRFGQYAAIHRQLLDRADLGAASILSPSADNTYAGLSDRLRERLWIAVLVGDQLFKMAARVRPYELHGGSTNALMADYTARAVERFERQGELIDVVAAAGSAFAALPRHDEQRPLVGIVGEIYVRNNEFTNENVVQTIEEAGAEAWMAPISEWILYTAAEEIRRAGISLRSPADFLALSKAHIKNRVLLHQEARFVEAGGALLADRHEPEMAEILAAGQRYLPYNTGGESILSLGRTALFIQHGAALVVNASPFGCMAGTVCAALFSRMEEELGAPVVNLFYDGHGDENRRLRSFLANIVPDTSRKDSERQATHSTRGFSPAPSLHKS